MSATSWTSSTSRLFDAIGAAAGDDPLERLREAFDAARVSLGQLWTFELIAVDGRSITLGKILLALLLVLLGYTVSRRASLALGRLLRDRLGVGSGAAAALQSLGFYLLLVIFLVWGLQLVGIPLTVFTLLGGVLAIGIGFGSQNVVNNFISGLILLAERPIKVGDLIEVQGVVGTVQSIGLRSTRVKSGDNTHIIVPNSTFLEQNVLNWTVSDDVMRVAVDVGVAYGSPTDQVAKLLAEAAEGSSHSLSGRGVEVLFMDFAADALAFRVLFWIRTKAALDTDRARSDVRFRIDDVLRQAKISIAFPQRDVHLDSIAPVEVRLVDRDTTETAS